MSHCLDVGIDVGGLVRNARVRWSPNFDARPKGVSPSLIVVHGISLPPGEYGGDAIEDLFLNRLDAHAHPAFESVASLCVSAHLLVRRDGELVQFVRLQDRAWHAGLSAFRGRSKCNDFAIGIELEGCDTDPYSDKQYTVLAALCGAMQQRYPAIRRDRVVGHSDISPGRKTDPGPAFNWSRLMREWDSQSLKGQNEK